MNNVKGAEAKLGPDVVSFAFGIGALRKANAMFKGRSVGTLMDDVKAGDIDSIVGLATCGLSHLRTYDDARVEAILEANPQQIPTIAAAVLVAMSHGYNRIVSPEHLEKLGKERAAALNASTPATTTAATDGPTSTSVSAPADDSASTPG